MAEKSDARQTLGKRGERLALDFLRRQGYRIHETNFRCRYGEIDIVASERNVLVFVEVRARSGSAFGSAAESITAHKQHKLRQVAELYLQTRYEGWSGAGKRPATVPRGSQQPPGRPPLPGQHNGELPTCRIDAVVISFEQDGRLERIELIRGAVDA